MTSHGSKKGSMKLFMSIVFQSGFTLFITVQWVYFKNLGSTLYYGEEQFVAIPTFKCFVYENH